MRRLAGIGWAAARAAAPSTFKRFAAGTACCLLLGSNSLAGESAGRQGVFLAPGWGKLSFKAPPPGSYELPVIDTAAGGEVLDANGRAVDLDELLGEKPTLLSFIYRTCDDVNGCPLSTMVLYTIGNKIAAQPELTDQLRLLTLSFDPEFDTPEVMKEYSKSILGDAKMDWHFLTTASENKIQPILQAYQQSVVPDPDAASGSRRKFSHLLRVYLIDRHKQVRNIYSLSFIHPDILINDVKTLVLEGQRSQPVRDATMEASIADQDSAAR
ncbi:MAG: SCO family protein [Gammaproteobacteria bacterium]|nr:SCO family protein [Gammaproteobacteria bacterium]